MNSNVIKEIASPFQGDAICFKWIKQLIKDYEDYLLCTYDEIKDHTLITIPEKAFLFYHIYSPHIVISCIATNPAYTKQGLGSLLVNHLKLPILVCTRKDIQTSNDFYIGLGFSQIGEVQKKWKKFIYDLNVYVKEK